MRHSTVLIGNVHVIEGTITVANVPLQQDTDVANAPVRDVTDVANVFVITDTDAVAKVL